MSAAGTAIAFAEAFAAPADALVPSLCLLGERNPADPFVTGERGDVLPCGQSFCVSLQRGCEVRGYTSILLALRLFRDADIPTGSYLKTDPHKTDSWKRRFAGFDKPVIGLAWRGRDKPRYRSIALEEFAGIFNSSGFQMLALKKDLTDEERKFLSKFSHVIDLSGNLRNFNDTASALESTDLVITIDTAIAHLAGAIGKETWVLLKLGAAVPSNRIRGLATGVARDTYWSRREVLPLTHCPKEANSS